jgi:3-methyl-2-oxobutanoate hydroxymethyltransferase
MGHLGLTPQSVHAMGGYRVQAREDEAAERLLADAQALEKSGIFSLVLEGIPSEVARRVTESVAVPTIGIGAGPHCDGQVLVINDLLGLGTGKYPKFVKTYADLNREITRAVRTFADEVEAGTFPDEAHSY